MKFFLQAIVCSSDVFFSLSWMIESPEFPTENWSSLQWTPTFHGTEAELVVKLLKSVVSMATAALCALLSASAGVTAARKQADRRFGMWNLSHKLFNLQGPPLMMPSREQFWSCILRKGFVFLYFWVFELANIAGMRWHWCIDPFFSLHVLSLSLRLAEQVASGWGFLELVCQ